VGKNPVLEAYADELSAHRLLESILWADGQTCPRCRVRGCGRKLGGRSRPNCFKCYSCQHIFSIRHGTVFERSRVPLRKWLQAIYLTDCGNLAVRPYRLALIIGVSRPTAIAMLRRLRSAMGQPTGPSRTLSAILKSLDIEDVAEPQASAAPW
jgi:transposase-like protein